MLESTEKCTYLYPIETLSTAEKYLEQLRSGERHAGEKLQEYIARHKIRMATIDPEMLIAFLMNTRVGYIDEYRLNFKEDHPSWTVEEAKILSEISMSTEGTIAFDHGNRGWPYHNMHSSPLPTHLLFISTAMMPYTKSGEQVCFQPTLVVDQQIDERAYYSFYAMRLLPGLTLQNQWAKAHDKYLIVKIPGLGAGNLAGAYHGDIKKQLPIVLKQFFIEHVEELDRVHTVIYDPYDELPMEDTLTGHIPRVNGSSIRFQIKPSIVTHEQQLQLPSDVHQDSSCLLLKVVCWGPFSRFEYGSYHRNSDLSAVTCATNLMASLINGQHYTQPSGAPLKAGYRYSKDSGLFLVDGLEEPLSQPSEFDRTYVLNITPDKFLGPIDPEHLAVILQTLEKNLYGVLIGLIAEYAFGISPPRQQALLSRSQAAFFGGSSNLESPIAASSSSTELEVAHHDVNGSSDVMLT